MIRYSTRLTVKQSLGRVVIKLQQKSVSQTNIITRSPSFLTLLRQPCSAWPASVVEPIQYDVLGFRILFTENELELNLMSYAPELVEPLGDVRNIAVALLLIDAITYPLDALVLVRQSLYAGNNLCLHCLVLLLVSGVVQLNEELHTV